MEPSKTYWATVAQVLPLIAVTIVIEARLLTQGWSTQPPSKLLRRILGTAWFAILITIAFAEPAAIRALRGEHVSQAWPDIIELTINWGLALIVAAPAVDYLLRGLAEPIAHLATSRPVFALATRAQSWRVNRILRGWAEEVARHEERHSTFSRSLDELETWRNRAKWALVTMEQAGRDNVPADVWSSRSELVDFVALAGENLRQGRQLAAEMRTVLDDGLEAIATHKRDLSGRDNSREEIHSLALKQRALLTKSFMTGVPVALLESEKSDEPGDESQGVGSA